MDFKLFKVAVSKQFEKMSKFELFEVDVDKNTLWETYLKSFPKGTDPLFKERTEHDCNCCKQFIRTIGNVITIVDGKMETIWDVEVGDPNYQVVANALANAVKSKRIASPFLHYQKAIGTDKNFQQVLDQVKTWNHFFINLPTKFVINKDDIGTALSKSKAFHDVMFRSLESITRDSIDTVLELIEQNSLYEGKNIKQQSKLSKSCISIQRFKTFKEPLEIKETIIYQT